jgi:hypothetical protein
LTALNENGKKRNVELLGFSLIGKLYNRATLVEERQEKDRGRHQDEHDQRTITY